MEKKTEKREEILRICSVGLRHVLAGIKLDYDSLQEIRLRAERPILVRCEQGEFFIGEQGQLLPDSIGAYIVSEKEIRETMEYVGNYSLYAYAEELRQGFLTVQGGHRVGVAGKVVVEQGKLKTIKNISFLHIRVAHEKRGCADKLIPWLYDNKKERICSSLLLSPPGCGKTTLLRDIIRQVSNGWPSSNKGLNVGVVDERSEIAACYLGVPQNDVGMRTDVLDGCPKKEGMLLLLRSMSPQVLAVDELGGAEDFEAVLNVAFSGCRVLATSHGDKIEETEKQWKKVMGDWHMERPVLERFVRLSREQGAGTVEEIRDGEGRILYNRKGEESNRKGEESDVGKNVRGRTSMGGMYRNRKLSGGMP